MGKVAKPLTIVVFSPLDTWPEFEKMEKQGHTIINMSEAYPTSDIIDCDIILGPRCWYMTELHRKHLQAAIKQARLRRYGTVSKKRKKGDDDEKDDIPSSDPESAGC